MKTIKIDQEEAPCSLLNLLLKQKYQQPAFKIHALILPAVIFLSMLSWKQQLWSAWVIVPLIWSILTLRNCWVIQSKWHRLHQLEQYKLDPIFWRQFSQQYPNLGLKQRRLIELGFKDYVALHVLQKQAYAMPSQAVDALWHVMLQSPQHYALFCHQTLGRRLNHQPYTTSTDLKECQQQLCQAWQYSCLLHGLNPKQAAHMPRLFMVDQLLNWQHGQCFDLHTMTARYTEHLQAQSSSSCGSGCSSCGGD